MAAQQPIQLQLVAVNDCTEFTYNHVDVTPQTDGRAHAVLLRLCELRVQLVVVATYREDLQRLGPAAVRAAEELELLLRRNESSSTLMQQPARPAPPQKATQDTKGSLK